MKEQIILIAKEKSQIQNNSFCALGTCTSQKVKNFFNNFRWLGSPNSSFKWHFSCNIMHCIKPTFAGEMPSTPATSEIHCSAIIIPWGPPNPRNAVLDGVLVLHTKPVTRRLGILYALSQCKMARSITWGGKSQVCKVFGSKCGKSISKSSVYITTKTVILN